MHYINQSFSFFYSDTIFNITSYLNPSDVCALAFVERFTFSVFTNSKLLAPTFANAIVQNRNVEFILNRPAPILSKVRILSDLVFRENDELKKLLTILPKLEQISFIDPRQVFSPINPETIQIISECCSELKVFSLPNHISEGIYLPEIARLTALKTLNLPDNFIRKENLSNLLKISTQLVNLKFTINTNSVNNDEFFLQHKNLKKLEIRLNGIGSTKMRCFSTMTALTNLTSLKLYSGLIPTLDPINHLTRLKKIQLNTLGETKELQKLKQLINLKKLSVRGHEKITDPACQAICQQFPNLEVLDLRYTNITDEGINSFLNLTNLRILSIENCEVSAEKIDQLRKRGVTVNHS